jgi:plasmid stabilization system protein ParE
MVFDEELRAALDQIRTAPQLGSAYQIMPGREHRRVLMPETRYHVYYRVTAPDRVRVLAIWSAVRGRGPRL